MATWDDVRAVAARLPETAEVGERPSWRVRGKLLAWERPLRRADLEALGDDAPTGPILGLRTRDLADKDEILAARPDVFFTTPHFDGYPAVLARLGALPVEVLEHLMRAAWLDRAPKKLVRAFLAAEDARAGPS